MPGAIGRSARRRVTEIPPIEHGVPGALAASLASRYTIERELGRGGMAVVYLASDIRHDRQVAIKVLLPELSFLLGGDRFLREIRLTARLQHPNILPLFDSGTADGLLYYVMPFVAGETLRTRLARERVLPIDDALHIATSALAGLGHAHASGILHRDIKPENILLAGGQAILADFGIALAVASAAGSRLTETGLSLGTPQYMSPEQATGERDLDARSDIYSMACVLYEMLAGDPPHTGSTVQAIVARVISERPAGIRVTRDTVPAHVEAAVLTALSKFPADRFASAAEFSQALTRPASRHLALPPTADSGERWKRRFLVAAGAGLVAGAAAVWAWVTRPNAPASHAIVARTAIDLPADQQLGHRPRAHPFDLSADGTQIAYVANTGSRWQLYLRRLDAAEPRAIAGTLGANQPFFSPDGQWIGFFADGRLQKVAVTGGAPISIAPVSNRPTGASWGDDGTILFHLEGKGLFRVNAGGGVPLAIAAAGTGGTWPHFLPGSRQALVTIGDSLAVVTLATGAVQSLLGGSQARYLPTGHLLYAADVGREVLQLVPFDVRKLRVTGEPMPALENVFRGEASSAIAFAVSRNGVLVYVLGGYRRTLVWLSPSGPEEVLPAEPLGYRFPALSPDGRRLALTVDPRPSDIWVLDLTRPDDARRLPTPEHEVGALWAPDGRGLVVAREDLFLLPWPEGGPLQRIAERPLPQYHPDWAGDGRLLAFEPNPETGDDLVWIDPATGSSDYFLRTPGNERTPSVSPDGKWVAFASDQTGTLEIYVVSYPVPGEQHRISTNGGIDPTWASGSTLYYQNGTTIMAATVRTTPGFALEGSPREVGNGTSGFTGWWDVARDGRVLVVRADRRTTRQFQVVFNWFDEIRAKGAR